MASINRFSFWSWLIAAPTFFLIPTYVDGLYERLLALIPAFWITVVSVHLIRETPVAPN